jgi:hypothetical protein
MAAKEGGQPEYHDAGGVIVAALIFGFVLGFIFAYFIL